MATQTLLSWSVFSKNTFLTLDVDCDCQCSESTCRRRAFSDSILEQHPESEALNLHGQEPGSKFGDSDGDTVSGCASSPRSIPSSSWLEDDFIPTSGSTCNAQAYGLCAGQMLMWQAPPMVVIAPPQSALEALPRRSCTDGIPHTSQAAGLTTVIMRNIPNNFHRFELLALLNSTGFDTQYDFAYLPIDFSRDANLGYAFLNFISSSAAQRFFEVFQGFTQWGIGDSAKVCKVAWSTGHQGLMAHIGKYRNSPLMHEDIPDDCKPVIFENGVLISFPPPTKPLRRPRFKNYNKQGTDSFCKKRTSR